MAYARVLEGAIVGIFQQGNPFTLDDNQYPSNWLTISSAADREAVGLYPVVYGAELDQRFYWTSNGQSTWNADLKQVDVAFTGTPKDIGTLKTGWLNSLRATAYAHLQTSDWMIVRAVEDPAKPVLPEWTAYRAAVRSECDRLVAAIEATVDVNGLVAAIDSNSWPVRP